MGRPSASASQRGSGTPRSKAPSLDAESVVRNERVYLHIYDYETREFSGLTTYHGLVRIYNSNTWPSRIFWCVVVLSCLSMFMIHSGIMLYGYHQKPTLTQVNVIVPEGGVLMPDVTVCGLQPVLQHKVDAWNMSESVLNYLLRFYHPAHLHQGRQLQQEHEAFLAYVLAFEHYNNRTFDARTFFDNVGPDCRDLVRACWWDGEAVPDCCALARPVMTEYGKCVSFPNGPYGRRQWFSGFNHGWDMVLDARVAEAERIGVVWDEYADLGVRVFVHDNTSFPKTRTNEVTGPPGSRMYIGLEQRTVRLLPKSDWGMCQGNWSAALHGPRSVPLPYSLAHCELNCEVNFFARKCGCVPIGLALNSTFAVCDPVELYNCEKYGTGEFRVEECNCSVECLRQEHQLQISYANLKLDGEMRRLAGLTNDAHVKYAKSNFVNVLIYMREISVEEHEQQKQMQTADLLSNIAGSMGLFLGMSTVTLLEIFIYLFKSIWGTVNTDRQRQFVKSVIEQEDADQQPLVLLEPGDGMEQESEDDGDDGDEGAPSTVRGDLESHGKQSLPEAVLAPNRRASMGLLARRQPKKSLTIVLNERRLSQARPSLQGSMLGLRPTRRPSHVLALDLTRRHSRTLTLSPDVLPQHQRRPSTTDLFRAMSPARRPSQAMLQPTALTARRPSLQPGADPEVHVQFTNRRQSTFAGFGGGRRPSVYQNKLI